MFHIKYMKRSYSKAVTPLLNFHRDSLFWAHHRTDIPVRYFHFRFRISYQIRFLLAYKCLLNIIDWRLQDVSFFEIDYATKSVVRESCQQHRFKGFKIESHVVFVWLVPLDRILLYQTRTNF